REWTDEVLKTGQVRLAQWREAARRQTGPDAAAVRQAVRQRLAYDLDTPGALTVVDDWATGALAGEGTDSPGAVAELVDALLGIDLLTD
ncbi:MAG: cysteine--1-D-myo-inosityl 2-amino-2-deoxy-alpha-D-glucopyranoside ligase, partial [Micromonosporaceae bacterium]